MATQNRSENLRLKMLNHLANNPNQQPVLTNNQMFGIRAETKRKFNGIANDNISVNTPDTPVRPLSMRCTLCELQGDYCPKLENPNAPCDSLG